MPSARVNGVELYYERSGAGEPLFLVHGSWGDHHNWDAVVPALSKSFDVVAFDRRGHSQSERPPGQGTVFEDADDLVALVEHLGLAPAHIAGNSFGAAITLRAATRRPDVFRALLAHEPPLFPLLAGTEFQPALDEVSRRIAAVVELLEAGDNEDGARLFVDTIGFGPGAGTTSSLPRCARPSSTTRRRGSTRPATRTPSSWTWRRSGSSTSPRC
jgi:pimeloyl-ACP methyl ester carboxylesterase